VKTAEMAGSAGHHGLNAAIYHLAMLTPADALRTPRCIWCNAAIAVRMDASWAYIRTQVTLHVVDCLERPDGAVVEDLTAAVDLVMKRAFGRER
jgi:hypothetical protein